MINCVINKLINSEEPSEVELMEVFDEIFSGVSDEVSATSFVTLLKEKEELFKTKSMCLSCAIKSARGLMTKAKAIPDNFPSFEVVETEDNSKFFDISFVMDIILSANDILSTKYSFPFQKKYSFETLQSFGINPQNIDDNFYENFEKTNFLCLNLSEKEPYFKYASNILRKLPFDNILNMTEKFLNPIGVKNQFIGVKDKDDVEKFANICLNIGNLNTIVLKSNNILPYASVDGETYIAEAWKNKIFAYTITPELLGFARYPLKDLISDNQEHNKEAILNLFDNKEKGAFYDFAVLNSALALYIVKKANSLMDGLKLAKNTIDTGLAKEKLVQLQQIYC